MMVEVRLRRAEDADGRRLCDWPIDRLDDLIRILGMWGVFDGDAVASHDDFTGEFRLDPVPHFDISVDTSDE